MIDDSRISESTVSYAVRVSNRDSHSTDFFLLSISLAALTWSTDS